MGWSADHLEAEAFAYLAVPSVKKLSLSFPGTTGVRQLVTGGRLARTPRPLEQIQVFPIPGGIPKLREQCESSVPLGMEGDHGARLQPGFA
jgi:hypothetical protein